MRLRATRIQTQEGRPDGIRKHEREGSRKRSRTDWQRVETMKDQDIDVSDNPELDEQFFREASAA